MSFFSAFWETRSGLSVDGLNFQDETWMKIRSSKMRG
jgi:hypothetical protein